MAWFICPIKLHPYMARTRYCAMDDFTAAIHADGGDWTESECLGNHAVVKVIASAATLAEINAAPGFIRIPVAHLDDSLSSLTAAQITAIRNKILSLGYPLEELQERFPNALGTYTLGDLLRFVLRRRLKPRWDEATGTIILDGPVQACRTIESVDGAVQ